MKVLSAEFVKSCESPEQFPRDRLPEIAFVGRSNVGKSSLINSLLGCKGLAKVSRTPGKTRILNFFRVMTADPLVKQFYLVDLPGYGYAKVAKSVRAHWGPMIEQYVKSRPTLRGVLLLVDPRRTDAPDAGTLAWLLGLGQRPVVVATKVDKLSRTDRRGHLETIRVGLDLGEDVPLVPYSSVSQEGRNELWQAIREIVKRST
jgi:GTP-binding protein